MAASAKPILWHIPVSHYNEKVRWALDYKGVEHERRAPPPPLHAAVALARTRGRHTTFPLLQLDGESIGDSTRIIAALEERFPEPPLYPPDEADRRRALELEEWFDEEFAPYMRRLGFHETFRDRERFETLAAQALPPQARRFRRPAAFVARTFVEARYHVKSEEGAEEARERVVAGLDRLEAELGDGDYLVAGRFTVADLTAAALFYPLVLPPEGPRIIEQHPEPLERFRAPLKERRGYRWVEEMYRRHRKRASDRAAAA